MDETSGTGTGGNRHAPGVWVHMDTEGRVEVHQDTGEPPPGVEISSLRPADSHPSDADVDAGPKTAVPPGTDEDPD